MEILFYDKSSPFAYTDLSLQQQAVRGTEGTVIRIAHALKNHHRIYVAQQARSTQENVERDGVQYISLQTANTLTPDIVIVIRDIRHAVSVAKLYPKARHFLWLHNMPPKDLHTLREDLVKHRYEIIAVSHFHAARITKRLQGKWYQRLFQWGKKNALPVHVLYNPIDEDLQPDHTPFKPRQLIFTSAPVKGLAQTLNIFSAVREQFPEYELLIAAPSEIDNSIQLPPGTRWIGPLPKQLLHQHIRESFCVFYPQTERKETFGLVYAEANALGTPVLAHDLGAASEVLSDTCQLVDGNNIQSVIDKLKEWRIKRPRLTAKSVFRLSNVVAAWEQFLSQQK